VLSAEYGEEGTPMPLTVAIQMDPLEGINIDADSTFVLALEARSAGAMRSGTICRRT
jgi:hypothetical protein